MKKLALILVIVGALNWGIIGLFAVDAIGYIFGGTYSAFSRIIYGLVGLAGIYLIPSLFSNDKTE